MAYIFKEGENVKRSPELYTVMEKVKIGIRYKFLTINVRYVICRFTYVFNDKRKATGRFTEVC